MAQKMDRISVFALAMMNVAIILSLRGLPLMAKEGLSLVFYLGFSILFFLFPLSFVSAELATGWPEGGGVYRWVKEAFGDHLGFVAIFLQWIQNVAWYPSVLSFAASALAYFFLDPSLSKNPWFIVLCIWTIYWSATLLNFFGLKMSGRFSSIAVISGTIVPGLFIILLGVFWVFSGNPIIAVEKSSLLPDFTSFSHIAFLAGNVLLFAGMEVSSVHALEVKNPTKDYPKAILIASIIIVLLFSLGSLSIGMIIPEKQISLTAGIMQAFLFFLEKFHLKALTPLMGLLIAFGAIGGVIAWIIGPSKGLLQTAKDGDLPPFLAKTNDRGVPKRILLIQGAIVSLLSLLYLNAQTIDTAFFMLSAFSAILYLTMYLLLYAAAIRLRYKYPEKPRPYKVPGGNLGMWCISGIGFFSALFAMIVGFFPPTQLFVKNPLSYVGFLLLGFLCFLLLPILTICFRNPSWKQNGKDR